jgi:hypothetical protein
MFCSAVGGNSAQYFKCTLDRKRPRQRERERERKGERDNFAPFVLEVEFSLVANYADHTQQKIIRGMLVTRRFLAFLFNAFSFASLFSLFVQETICHIKYVVGVWVMQYMQQFKKSGLCNDSVFRHAHT